MEENIEDPTKNDPETNWGILKTRLSILSARTVILAIGAVILFLLSACGLYNFAQGQMQIPGTQYNGNQ